MADLLLDEVNADVRAERLHGLWMQYRKTLALAVAALILGTAGNALWNHYQQKRGSELMMQFRTAQQLLSQKKYDEAANSFAVLARGTDGELNNLAQIWQARALVAAGKKPEAIDVLRGASTMAPRSGAILRACASRVWMQKPRPVWTRKRQRRWLGSVHSGQRPMLGRRAI